MSLPDNFFLQPPGNERNDILRLYQEVKNSVNQSVSVKPFVTSNLNNLIEVYGGTSAGSGSYNVREGIYIKNGPVIEYWAFLKWTGHTGTGELRITIPFESRLIQGAFVGTAEVQNLAYPAGVTQTIFEIGSGLNYATVQGTQSGAAKSSLQLAAAGTIQGHIRYLANE